jgi:NAD(P)-dependent dehydrogenase (short-subunit alcohol dehydrogenase family)
MHPLQNKVVLITGGSSGIGRETALRLAGLGCRIGLAARTREPLESAAEEVRELGGQALVIPTDVADKEQCRRAVEETVAQFGRLDILLCSAGLSMRTYFERSDLTAMEQVMRVNLFGTMFATYFALPHVKRTRGSLVAISSLTGKRGIPSYSVYGASKFAVRGLYESLRLELRRDGVHVGVVSPGFVDTPLRERVLGPDGTQWENPPPPPFRIWPVKKCVDRVIRLLTKRRSEVLLPSFIGPLLWLDQSVGCWVGNQILTRKFPPM